MEIDQESTIMIGSVSKIDDRFLNVIGSQGSIDAPGQQQRRRDVARWSRTKSFRRLYHTLLPAIRLPTFSGHSTQSNQFVRFGCGEKLCGETLMVFSVGKTVFFSINAII